MSARVLRAIMETDLPPDADLRGALLGDSLDVLRRLYSDDSLDAAFVELALRAIETRILADSELVALAKYWPAQVGRADAIVERRIRDLVGVVPPREVVQYVKQCVRAHHAWTGKANIPWDVVQDVFERAAREADSSGELRCSVCGYHFQKDDVGKDRRELATQLGLVLAVGLDPDRSSDIVKPVATTGKKAGISLTQLALDHLTPESGFGWTEPNNLRITCSFCNNGRSYYRRPLEAVGSSAASSLLAILQPLSHSRPRQQTVVATFQRARGRCEACSGTTRSREVTVRPRRPGGADAEWFFPWALRTICYPCVRRGG